MLSNWVLITTTLQKKLLLHGPVSDWTNGQTNANVFLKHFYIGGLQVGGGITVENAQKWIDLGADKVKDEYKRMAPLGLKVNLDHLTGHRHQLPIS